jgi:putative oxidoreductase
MNQSTCCAKWAAVGQAALRIVAGYLFLEHGTQKLFGWPLPAHGPLNTMMLVGGWLEFVGGILILIGFLTRPVAFILCGEMAFAFFTVHCLPNLHDKGPLPIQNGGDLAVLFCFVFLYFVFAGAGPASVDRCLCCRKCDEGKTDVSTPAPAPQ